MSQITLSQVQETETSISDWNRLTQLGGYAAIAQLVCLLVSMGIMIAVGGEPTTAEEYFQALNSGFTGLMRLDFGTLILIVLFPFVAFGVYAALRHSRQAYAMLAMILVIIGTVLGLANHSAFSMMHLSDLYAAAAAPAQQAQLLTAGETIIASDMWHTTAGFLAGLFMQGGFVFISFVMLRVSGFSKWTAYTGMIANGLDFVHVIVGLFAPTLAFGMLAVGGIFYVVWFPLLGRDLIRLGKV